MGLLANMYLNFGLAPKFLNTEEIDHFIFFRPYVCLLGRIPDTDIYRDINIYQEVCAVSFEDNRIFMLKNAEIIIINLSYLCCQCI